MDYNPNTDTQRDESFIKTDPDAFRADKEERKPAESGSPEERLKEKYGKVYKVAVVITPDDETELPRDYYFQKPGTPSYNRYLKTASDNMVRALTTFMFDAVADESREQLEEDLAEYPALTMSIGEKLLSMLGLAKNTNLRML